MQNIGASNPERMGSEAMILSTWEFLVSLLLGRKVHDVVGLN